MPTRIIEIQTAGPACSAAAWPVRTKMPAPMIAPIPRVTRFRGPRARCSECSPVSSASARSAVMDFVAHRLIEAPFAAGRGATPARRMACTLGCAGARRQGGAGRSRVPAAAQADAIIAAKWVTCRRPGAACSMAWWSARRSATTWPAASSRVQQALGRPPALGIVLVGDGSGVRGLRPQQGPHRRRVRPDRRPDPPAGDRLARGRPRRGAAPERQPRARRHPGAVAAAGGARARTPR